MIAIRAAIEAGEVQFDESAEDIHMNVEMLLTEKIGCILLEVVMTRLLSICASGSVGRLPKPKR